MAESVGMYFEVKNPHYENIRDADTNEVNMLTGASER